MIRILQKTQIRKPKIAIFIMAVLFSCLWATAAFASWSQIFTEDGKYDKKNYGITGIEVFRIDGTSGLENPGMSDFSKGTWSVQMPNSDYILATNNKDVRNFSWLFSFTGTSSDSLHLVYLAYTDTGDVFGSDLSYNYGSTNWSVSFDGLVNPADYDSYRTASAVPIPSSLFLLSTGLLGFVGIRRKINVFS